MSNVIQLHSTRRGPGNHPDAVFLAKVLTTGAPAMLRKIRTHLWMDRPAERDGRYAVVGRQLLHLAGWSTCHLTVSVMRRSLLEGVTESPGEILELPSWPYDVSSWPSTWLADAPSAWHLPIDQWQEVANGCA